MKKLLILLAVCIFFYACAVESVELGEGVTMEVHNSDGTITKYVGSADGKATKTVVKN